MVINHPILGVPNLWTPKKTEAPMAGDGLLDILGGPAGVTPAATEAAPMVAFEKPHGNGES